MSIRTRPSQQLPNGTIVTKQAEGGMRRIRCPKCQNLATPVTNKKGQQIAQCGSCGTQWSSSPM